MQNENSEKLSFLLDKIPPLLAEDGITLDGPQIRQLSQHAALVRQWNRVVGVVSINEVELLWERHIADSLSVASLVSRMGYASGHLLDIGSGGGFPAIPVKVVLPNLNVSLVERSERKVGFLRKVVGALGLNGITVTCAEFSQLQLETAPDVITARAVESPERLAKQFLNYVDAGSQLLSQSGVRFGEGYRVEQVSDQWTNTGLRRGKLEIVRRRNE